MNRNALLLLLLLVAAAVSPGEAAVSESDVKSFAAAAGDTLVVENDYGRVQIQSWDRPEVEVRIRKIASDQAHLRNVEVLAQKSGSKIYLRSYFYSYASESVYLEIMAPRELNLTISGANLATEVLGMTGYVRVHTLTGLITAEDLTDSASLITESGDILFRAHLQPYRDIRLESVRGDVHCFVHPSLSFRAWARAGGKVSWNGEVEMTQAQLERQLGTGGPLFFMASLEGNVNVYLEEGTSPLSRAEPGPRRREPLPPRSTDSDPGDPQPAADLEREAEATRAGTDSPNPAVVRGTTDPETGSVNTGYTLTVNVDWIYLNVAVRDRYNNRSIPNLKREDFLVHEDGVQQTVEKFSTTEAPFSLLLLLDVSGSTKDYIDLIKQASIDFTREIKSNDRIAVAVFNSDVHLVQDFTNDRARVANVLRRIRSGGGTAFYDALDTSIQDYMRDIEGRKAIVVFSDGVDNQLTGDYSNGSRIAFDELFRNIQEIDTTIYTIFLDTEDQGPVWSGGGRRRGGGLSDILGDILRGRTPPYGGGGPVSGDAYEEARRQMELIADQTGGRLYSPRHINDLSRVYTEIADDLRVQYTLAYSSTNPAKDGKWREIRVKIHNRPDAVARTRKGYYSGRNG